MKQVGPLVPQAVPEGQVLLVSREAMVLEEEDGATATQVDLEGYLSRRLGWGEEEGEELEWVWEILL
jgi:hypothetical protein